MSRSPQESRVAIVTGTAAGIGRAIAQRLAADGARVAMLDINAAGLQETLALIEAEGGTAMALPCDVTDQAAVRQAVAAVRDAWGAPLIAVSNAGIGGGQIRFHQDTTEHLWRQLSIHVGGAFNLFRETIEPMREAGWGRIVGISSIGARVGYAGGSAYACAKGGLLGLVRTIALENTARGVTANCVLPGVTRTPAIDRIPAERVERMLANNPARRFAEPEEIAAAVAYLVSAQAGYVTGQSLSPNGGLWFS
jgi:2-hydroxycyclohexanecarboxyl-CoA dehydrogenase